MNVRILELDEKMLEFEGKWAGEDYQLHFDKPEVFLAIDPETDDFTKEIPFDEMIKIQAVKDLFYCTECHNKGEGRCTECEGLGMLQEIYYYHNLKKEQINRNL